MSVRQRRLTSRCAHALRRFGNCSPQTATWLAIDAPAHAPCPVVTDTRMARAPPRRPLWSAALHARVHRCERCITGGALQVACASNTAQAALARRRKSTGLPSPSQAMWPKLQSLKWIHSASAGLDALLFQELIDSAVTVTNARGVYSHSLAEYALACCLWFAKDLPRMRAAQRGRRWDQYEVEELRGAPLWPRMISSLMNDGRALLWMRVTLQVSFLPQCLRGIQDFMHVGMVASCVQSRACHGQGCPACA